MTDSSVTGLVVGQVEGHSLVHLRMAGGERTMCGRSATEDWPTANFRKTGCLTCHAGGLAHGYTYALDTDGTWLNLEQLVDEMSEDMTA